MGYFTDWSWAPDLKPGRKNEQVRVPVLAPAWVRIQLVDELPKSRIQLSITGYSGSGEQLRYPRDTTFIRTISAQYSRNCSQLSGCSSSMNADRTLLTDKMWTELSPLLPGQAGSCGVTAADTRGFVEAV
ncbi:hypothetical protein J7E24_17040, partial [Hymenobacter sp. ISL-91]|nr:hypothetical protein [Hymenobacter sp. ISL-91]